MSEPTTKQDLFDQIARERTALHELVSQAGPERAQQPGAMGDWTLKDTIAHLTDWRRWSIVRFDAVRTGGDLEQLWPSELGDDTEAINNWFYRQSKDKSLEQVLAESEASFDQLEQGVQALSDADLFTAGRFPWMKGKALGPSLVASSVEHFYEEHEASLREWINKGKSE